MTKRELRTTAFQSKVYNEARDSQFNRQSRVLLQYLHRKQVVSRLQLRFWQLWGPF
jgi:hypothetical protein